MAKKKKKPDSDLDLDVDEPVAEEEPALADDDEPALADDEDAAEVTADDEDAAEVTADDADQPAGLLDDADIDAVVSGQDDDHEPAAVGADGAAIQAGAAAGGAGAAPDQPPPTDTSEFDEDAEPEPGLTLVNVGLILLNVLAALAFVYTLSLNYSARTKIQMDIAAIELARSGLPLLAEGDVSKDERHYESAFHTTQPQVRYDSDALQEATAKLKPKQFQEKLQPETLAVRMPIPAGMLPKEFFDKYFQQAGPPVKTQEEEVNRLKGAVPGLIAEAAKEAGKKDRDDLDNEKATPEEKNAAELRLRNLTYALLMPLARNSQQVLAFDDKIKSLDRKQLSEFVKEAAERRMYADLLMPLNDFRPLAIPRTGSLFKDDEKDNADKKDEAKKDEAKKEDGKDDKQEKKEEKKDTPESPPSESSNKFHLIEYLADLVPGKDDARAMVFRVSLDDLKEMFEQRCTEAITKDNIWVLPQSDPNKEKGMKRYSIEKRRHIAFLVLVAHRLERPPLTGALYDPDDLAGKVIAAAEKQEYVFADKAQFEKQLKDFLKARVGQAESALDFVPVLVDELVKNNVVPKQPEADPDKAKAQKDSDKKEAFVRDLYRMLTTSSYLLPNAIERPQYVSGQREYAQACDTLAAIVRQDERRLLTAIARDRGGEYLYPGYQGRLGLNGKQDDAAKRIQDEFVVRLHRLLTVMKIDAPPENGFVKSFEKFWEKEHERNKEKKEPFDVEAFMANITDYLGTDAKVVLPADPVEKTAFQRELFRLLDPREMGFVARQQDAVRRIQDIAEVIKDRNERLLEVMSQEKAREGLFTERSAYADALLVKVVAERAETKRLADNLRQLQEQLFRAQLELASVEEDNQRMERRIRLLERTYRGKGGKK
jgi:hypothetical protein